MNLPGFTADATLYKTNVNYKTVGSHFAQQAATESCRNYPSASAKLIVTGFKILF